MSEELEIRAAKVYYEKNYNDLNGVRCWTNSTPHVHVYGDGNLHFTTSYDWAMLLVKKCYSLDKSAGAFYQDIDFNIGKILGHDYHLERCSIRDVLLLTPEQITLAAVEVLEAQK